MIFEVSVFNVVKSIFEFEIPEFVYESLDPDPFMEQLHKRIQFSFSGGVGDATLSTAIPEYGRSKEIKDKVTLGGPSVRIVFPGHIAERCP